MSSALSQLGLGENVLMGNLQAGQIEFKRCRHLPVIEGLMRRRYCVALWDL